jgi:ribosome-associated heat shock protein Hsp15
MKAMDKTRIDKWLWAVRIFKSRSMAADACKNGRVKTMSGTILKPSSNVNRGDLIQVRKDHFNFTFKVLDIIDKRVSAKLAEPCYENLTTAEELNKFKTWFISSQPTEFRDKGSGRPTKKERREIDDFKIDLVTEEIPENFIEDENNSEDELFNFDE